VYVINLSPELANEAVNPTQTLSQYEYFGQYGSIKKCVVNTAKPYSHAAGPSYSAHVTFQEDEDAAKCIKAVGGFEIHRRELNATYGTTKYCAYFLNSVKCPKAECLYLHKLGASEDTLSREGNSQLKQVKVHLLKNHNIEVDPPGTLRTVFPSARLIRARNLSEDNFNVPIRTVRRFSLITPDRTRSRFEFVQDSSEEMPGEVPDYISQMVSLSSQLKDNTELLLVPKSPDYWFGDTVDNELQEVVRRLSMDEVSPALVKTKSVF
jgi:hypothetical protein